MVTLQPIALLPDRAFDIFCIYYQSGFDLLETWRKAASLTASAIDLDTSLQILD